MARYIDADALKERLEYFSKWCKDGRKQGVDFVLDCPLPDMPTADVAPRAEVAREIFEEIDKRFEAVLGFYPCNGEFEDAKGFVDFHWKYIKRSIMRDYDPDFEKKYTEPEPPKAKQPKDLENFEKKRLLAGDCFHGEIWYRCPYCLTGIEAHSIPKDRICYNCGKEYL